MKATRIISNQKPVDWDIPQWFTCNSLICLSDGNYDIDKFSAFVLPSDSNEGQYYSDLLKSLWSPVEGELTIIIGN